MVFLSVGIASPGPHSLGRPGTLSAILLSRLARNSTGGAIATYPPVSATAAVGHGHWLRRDGMFVIHEFGPDVPPVIGAQVTAVHRAAGELLDLHTTLNGDRAPAISPIRDIRGVRTDRSRHRVHRAAALGREVFGKLHNGERLARCYLFTQ